jgi:hypothetical protein
MLSPCLSNQVFFMASSLSFLEGLQEFNQGLSIAEATTSTLNKIVSYSISFFTAEVMATPLFFTSPINTIQLTIAKTAFWAVSKKVVADFAYKKGLLQIDAAVGTVLAAQVLDPAGPVAAYGQAAALVADRFELPEKAGLFPLLGYLKTDPMMQRMADSTLIGLTFSQVFGHIANQTGVV